MRGLGEETVGAWLAASVSVPQRCFELVPKSPAGSGGLSAAATFAAAKVHRTSTRGPPATCGPPDGKSGAEAADVTALLQAHEAPLRGPVHVGTRPREHFAPARGGASRGGRVPDPWASWGLACAVWGLPPLPCVWSRGSAHVHGRGAGYVREVRERDEVSSAAGREHPAPAVTGRGAPRKGPGAARRRPRTEAPLWGLALGSGCLLRGRRSVEPHVLAGAWPLWTHRSSGCPSVRPTPAEPTSSWRRVAEGRGWAGRAQLPPRPRVGGVPAVAPLRPPWAPAHSQSPSGAAVVVRSRGRTCGSRCAREPHDTPLSGVGWCPAAVPNL